MPLRAPHPTYWATSNTLTSSPSNPLTQLIVQLAHSDAELSCVLLGADNHNTMHIVRKGRPFSPSDAVWLQTSRFASHLTIDLTRLALERTPQLRVFISSLPDQTPSHSTLVFSGTTATDEHFPLGELHLPPVLSCETPHLEVLRLTPDLPTEKLSVFQQIIHNLTLQPLSPVPFNATIPLTLTAGPVLHSPQQTGIPLNLE